MLLFVYVVTLRLENALVAACNTTADLALPPKKY